VKSLLAIGAVLSLVAVAASCSGGGSGDGAALIEKARQAMASASFSHSVTDCHLCPPPIVTEYAPPDRIKLSDPKGHDDWPYYLIAGDQWLVSHRGSRWLSEGISYHHPSMLLSDPRVLLRIAAEPEIEGDDVIDGEGNQVLRMGVDLDRFFTDILPADVPEEMRGGEAREFYDTHYGALIVRLWIDEQTYLVSQMEFDLPRLPADDEGQSGDDPEPYAVSFDYDTPIDVPEEPESMPYEEADQLRREADRRIEPLLDAIDLYRSLNGVYPASLDPETLKDVLLPAEWPVNPFSNEPMKQSDDSPGDFDYRVKNSGNDYEATFFGWDSAYLFRDTAPSGPQG
jgi:hypothetical protein